MAAEEESFDQMMREKYLFLRELLEVKCKTDPSATPFKSKYSARDVLKEMEDVLLERKTKYGLDVRETAMLSAVYTIFGTVSLEVEETSTGEKYLFQSLDLIKDDGTNPSYVLTFLSTLNEIALLYSIREENDKALEFLLRAEKVYKECKELKLTDPISYSELFKTIEDGQESKGNEVLEKTHTLTLYYLAQAYKVKGSVIESAAYCHITLRRQLDTVNYDKIDWALNSASLSQFFVEKNCFKEARHHLAAASLVLSLRLKDIEKAKDESTDEYEANYEQYCHRKSDVYRCWIKYCIALMITSKERLMASDENETAPRDPFNARFDNLNFTTLDVETQEKMVTADYLLTIEDARPVFYFGQSCVNKTMEYYTLESHASDYILIAQDLSQLYLSFAFFEDDEQKQYKLHKKRKDLLKKTVSALNETYYLDVCRELWLEIGIILKTLADTKTITSEIDAAKRNQTALEGISYFQKFVSSFNDKNGDTPDVFPSDFERVILLSHLYMAQLHSKLVHPDKKKVLEFVVQSLKYHQFVVNYCEKNPKGVQNFAAELAVCKDMVCLLPMKLNKLSSQLQ